MSAWRVIITDSEDLTGVAPVCPRTDGLHALRIDQYLEPSVDMHGVYDCCPGPQIETWNTQQAERLAAMLTEFDAEQCP